MRALEPSQSRSRLGGWKQRPPRVTQGGGVRALRPRLRGEEEERWRNRTCGSAARVSQAGREASEDPRPGSGVSGGASAEPWGTRPPGTGFLHWGLPSRVRDEHFKIHLIRREFSPYSLCA